MHPTNTIETNKLEILSKEIERETVRKGGWRRKEWSGKVLVVLIFGVRSDTTRTYFKKKCNEIGLHFLTIRGVERGGRTLPSHAKEEREQEVGNDRDE